MKSFIELLRSLDGEYENITYTFESIYPDKKTMDRIENQWRDYQNKLIDSENKESEGRDI